MTDSLSNSGSRREFLGKTSAAVVAGIAIGQAASTEAAVASNGDVDTKFQPEAFWKDRMTAPDDGKMFGWLVDTRRCFGCHACEVSCKSENDVPLGNFIRQTIYKDVGEYPKVARLFLPMACQHCEDAPCIKACPCGALHKEVGGTVAVNYEVCSGHGTCAEVCPYGAIYLDPVAKQAVKCHNCYHRLEHDMEPACVPTCPSEALYFGDLNDPESKISQAKAEQQKGATHCSLILPCGRRGFSQVGEPETVRPPTLACGPRPAHIETGGAVRVLTHSGSPVGKQKQVDREDLSRNRFLRQPAEPGSVIFE